MVLSVPPVFASNPRDGAHEMLDSMLMRYIPALRGVVLAHSNLTFLKPTASITADCPFLVCHVQFDATVWSPHVGMKLVGKISLCSPDHISLLVHRTFNVSIPRQHIPPEWTFEPADDERGEWVEGTSGKRLGGEDGYLEFRVVGLTVANSMLSLDGALDVTPTDAAPLRPSGSPLLDDAESSDFISELSIEDDLEIDETFSKHASLPGNVKIIVQNTTFWAHKAILWFASPFFQSALGGNWAETGRPQSMSSVITISQTPSDPGNKSAPTEMTFTPMDPDIAEDSESSSQESSADSDDHSKPTDLPPEPTEQAKAQAIDESLAKLESNPVRPQPKRRTTSVHDAIAVIVLKEERASTFHDFLKFIYPHLECTITWNNAESLMNISHKLCVPALQQECLKFLLAHAAGRPIKALRIAEIFEEEELYQQASRFVLDNPGGWTEQELNTLSRDTLLKLEKRRNWFLERVLKLGLTRIDKEYQCCATCPDSANCARVLEDKWRQAYHAVFRIGPPRPSMVFRYLRQLEVEKPLSMTHLSCQMSAKAFVATLFDRMFSLGVRGSGTEAGPRRHFLYCSLKPEPQPQAKRSREIMASTSV
ncbi:BTB domain-containing protein [Mycena chlorophos]|uniref:BTB domain-containing protein n=1 Tax=Mycena chlorophos TaxID=658473 RepID=A0A8H6SG26_MYCCL|nr:BTB domain-containing protein [Mycena chlorophos]